MLLVLRIVMISSELLKRSPSLGRKSACWRFVGREGSGFVGLIAVLTLALTPLRGRVFVLTSTRDESSSICSRHDGYPQEIEYVVGAGVDGDGVD